MANDLLFGSNARNEIAKGIKILASFIYGFPEETEEDVSETLSLLIKLENLNMLEINNGASNRGSDMDYTPYVYDQMLRLGKRISCVGGDDNHNTIHFFKAWTMVKAESLTHENILNAIENGDTYASSGPEIYELYFEDEKVHIKCSEADSVYIYTAGRRRSRTSELKEGESLTEATFEIKPTDHYFRLTVKDKNGKYANTRAYFLDELK